MFKHAEQALRFAFRMREKSLITRTNLTPHDGGRSSQTLTAHDFHAQAGMVFSFLERQPPHQQAYAYLMFGSPQERESAASLLSVDLAVPKHLKSRSELKKALLTKTVRDCAKSLGMSNYKAWKTKQTLHGMLEPIAIRLYDNVEGWLGIQT